ncbi:MgtC/SapB family protein [Evansella cellulosilytica]|uniref:MgtC/SapB transporter n=1 Tax=Evansella cellulosilytica (strain ATCC 21833 / DSM 2522 / FERM P-1141 / JCM 9156 / N-4) TaxID=649639 RepID=E6TSF9_EVAC2|nr:MgtC/SapB family protein [Evansella cellulosilytica]ADU28374.1 MgtC/SapB transporter [Evansella cellulosilytica DSM 2522]
MLDILANDTFIMTVRLVLAAILGGLVGVEREYHQHPAGFRTHLLVSVGSCLIMLLAFYGFQTYMSENENYINFDPSRLAAYVVSGIGFLGAGTILVQGYTVRGLTTAASIWVVAGIGLTVGAGLYTPAIITTVIVILSLYLLGKIDFNFLSKAQKNNIYITVDENKSTLTSIISVCEQLDIQIKAISSERQEGYKESSVIEYRLYVATVEEKTYYALVEALQNYEFVRKINIDAK